MLSAQRTTLLELVLSWVRVTVESGWSVGGEASTASVKSFDKASK